VTDMDMDARTRTALGESESGDPEVDELVDDIVETREEMTVTVEEIGDRLDPRNIVAGAKETVREATLGKVEDMANTAGAMVSDAGDTVREAGSGIVDTITRNPIPAAMVGVGLGWLALSRRPSSQYGRDGWRPAYDHRSYGAGTYDTSSYDTGSYDDRSAVGKVQERAGEMADKVGRTVDDVTGQVGRTAEQLPYQVRSTADHIGAEAGRLFQSSPLVFGAIAAAVGTAIGLAMPATQMERRAIAQPARQVLERAEEAATEAIEGVEQTAREAEQQAREQDGKTRAH
jgi:Protein of unknown function (DUF3618)